MLGNNNYKIIDNFLDRVQLHDLKNFIYSEQLPWYHRRNDTNLDTSKNRNGFFSFCFYNEGRPDHKAFDELIVPIVIKLGGYLPVQIRANLVCRDKDTIECDWHNDFNHEEYGKTAILYLTTCNAKTLLKVPNKIIEVDCIENRVVIFKSKIKHKVKYQTDVHKRYVINFNYI